MISGLVVVKMREVNALVKSAHDKRRQINDIVTNVKKRGGGEIYYDEAVSYRHSMNAIKELLYQINSRFNEIKDLVVEEKSTISRLYIRYWLWVETKYLNPVLRLVYQ